MLGSQGFLPNTNSPLIEGLGLLVALLYAVNKSQIVEGNSYLGMLGSQRLFSNAQGALEERLRLLVLALLAVEDSQIDQRGSHIGVLGSQRMFSNAQGALEERLRLLVLALLAVEDGKVVQREGSLWVVVHLPNVERSLEKRLGLLVFALLQGEEGQMVQRFPHLDVGRLQMALLNGQHAGCQLFGAAVFALAPEQFSLGCQTRDERWMVESVVPFSQRHRLLQQGIGLFKTSTPHQIASGLPEQLACLWQILACPCHQRHTGQRLCQVPFTLSPGGKIPLGERLVDEVERSLGPLLLSIFWQAPLEDRLDQPMDRDGSCLRIALNEGISEQVIAEGVELKGMGDHRLQRGAQVRCMLGKERFRDGIGGEEATQGQQISRRRIGLVQSLKGEGKRF